MERVMEREVSLKNLFWKVLLGWRRWFIVGVCFAIVVVGIKYMRDSSVYQNDLKNNSVEEEPLKEEEQKVVEEAEKVQKQISELQTYIQNSVLMRSDAFHENVLLLQYYIDSDYTFNYTEQSKKDYLDELITAYSNYVKSGEMAEIIAKELDLDKKENYVNELITTDGNKGIFRISIVYLDDKSLEALQPIIMEAMDKQTAEIAEKIGSHTLKLVSGEVLVHTNKELARLQKEQYEVLDEYRTQLAVLKGSMTTAQLKALGIEVESTESENIVAVKPGLSIKYAILGFIIGVLLACLWESLKVLFASRLQESSDLCLLYGIRLLGDVNVMDRKKKFLGIIDEMILRLKNRNKKQLTREQQYQIVCSNIEIACKRNEQNRIYFTGTSIQNIDKEGLDGIRKSLQLAGISMDWGENISYHGESLKKAVEVGVVVFIEKMDVSLYTEMEREIKFAIENDIQIMGSIVVV